MTPYEAGLGWIVKLEKGADFTGLAALKRQTYLPVAQAKPGTRFTIDVRGKRAPAEVVGMPFVPRRTKK